MKQSLHRDLWKITFVYGLTPQSICIDYPLIKSVKSVGVKSKCYQEQQQNEKQKNEAKIQQKDKSSDMFRLPNAYNRANNSRRGMGG